MRILKTAIITGAAGQDGLILGKILCENDYRVVGYVKNHRQLDRLKNFNCKVEGKILENPSVDLIRSEIFLTQPSEIYNLAAVSSVAESWINQDLCDNTNFNYAELWLKALHIENLRSVKFYQASSSEMYGNSIGVIKNELSDFNPVSPYAKSKLKTHELVQKYREEYHLFAATGILFNHESPLRDKRFVSRKITSSVAQIALGNLKKIELGNIAILRDWGWAPDYVRAMRLILKETEASDFVIASGTSYSVENFLTFAFELANIRNWQDYVLINKTLFRPNEILEIVGDSHKAQLKLGWKPRTNFYTMIERMLKYDFDVAKHKIAPDLWCDFQ